MEYWFTADQHFDHTNVIKYCNRPFASIEEMNGVIINNFNEVVCSGDLVIIAGDLCLSHRPAVAQKWLKRLNGQKIVLRGNHDHWDKEKRYIYHKKIGDQHIAVCHYPMESWQNSCHGSWHLHGHCHGQIRTIPNRLDIGVDCHNFYPVAFSQLPELIELGKQTSECKKLKIMGREK